MSQNFDTTIGLSADFSSAGQPFDFDGAFVTGLVIANNSGVGIQYTPDGITWTTINPGGSASPAVPDSTTFYLRKLAAGGAPASVRLTWRARDSLDPSSVAITGGTIALPVAGPSLFFDNFSRADTSAGSLGTVPGQSAYTMQRYNGSALVPATDGYIQSGRYVSQSGSVVYATQDVRGPVNLIGAKIGWSVGNGGASAGTFTLLISPVGGASLITNVSLHLVVTRSFFQIQYIKAGAFTTLLTYSFLNTIPLNQEVVCEARIDGNVILYNVNGVTGRLKNPMFASLGLGQFATWEHFYATSSVSELVYTTAVWAGTSNPVGNNPPQDLAVAAYRFKSTSWLDSSGQGHTLTGSGSPTVVAGVQFPSGKAVNLLAASSQFLTATSFDDAVLAGKDFTWVMWVTLLSLPGSFYSLLNKVSAGGAIEYELYVASSGQVVAQVQPGGTGTVYAPSSSSNLAVGTPSLVAFRYRSQDQTTGVSINAGAFASVTTVGGIFGGTAALNIGRSVRLSAFCDAKFEELTLFSSPPGHGGALSTENLLRIYKDGDGMQWPY